MPHTLIQQDYENIEFYDNSGDRSYFTMIPNCILRMGLDSYEISAYLSFKSAAGDRGRCFKANNTICNEIGCKNTKLVEVKKSLEKKGLISILKRKNEKGCCLPDLITINDIWSLNIQIILDGKNKEVVRQTNHPGSPNEPPLPRQTNHPGSPNERKEEQEIQEEQKKQQQQEPKKSNITYINGQSVDFAAAVFLNPSNNQQSIESTAKKEVLKSIQLKKPLSYAILDSIDIPQGDKIEITSRYSEEEVLHAIKWSQHPTTKITQSLAAAIKWACKTQPSIPIEKTQEEKKKVVMASDYEGVHRSSYNKIYNYLFKRYAELARTIRELSEGIELPNRNKILYRDSSFFDQLKNFLYKNNVVDAGLFKYMDDCKNQY